MPAFRIRPATSRQTGFTIVELMVGLAIGMLLVLVIVQVMGVFEAKNRATMGNADAQTNGGIALYSISRDLQLAGYSLMPEESSALECTVLNINIAGIGDISPVSIVDGVAAAGVSASDSIVIRYGSSTKGGVFTAITAAPTPTAAPAGTIPVTNNLGCKTNDIAFIANGTSCALTKVTGPTDLATPPVASSPPNTTTVAVENTTGAVSGGSLACLGNWNQVSYAVNNGALLRNGVPLLAGVVNLQAQYGISATANSNQIAQWVNASGATWAAPSFADRNRIKAVRLAVIARNDKVDGTNVSNPCSSLTAASPTGLCAWEGSAASPAPQVDLSSGDPNWQRYRYRVFETVIPLRNVIWSKDTL